MNHQLDLFSTEFDKLFTRSTGALGMYHCTSGRLRFPLDDRVPVGAMKVRDRYLQGPRDFRSIETQITVSCLILIYRLFD